MTRHHPPFLLLIATLALLVCLNLVWASREVQRANRERMPQARQLVAQLGLTDLSIWSEARYTRHPTQADLFTPFQEFPGSLEHFPAGSLVHPSSRTETTTLTLPAGKRP